MLASQRLAYQEQRRWKGLWAEASVARAFLCEGDRRVFHDLRMRRAQIDLLVVGKRELRLIEVKHIVNWDLAHAAIKQKQMRNLMCLQQSLSFSLACDVQVSWVLIDQRGRTERIQDF